MILEAFKSVICNYKAIFLDSYGVLKNHKGLIPGVESTIDFIKDQNKLYYVLTNDASTSPAQLAKKFEKMGLPGIEAEKVISSGMMAREYLRYKIKSGRVAYLGTEDSAHYIEEAGLETISISDLELDKIEEVSALVFLDDEGFDWNKDINKTVNLIRKKNMPVIVANSDYTYPVSRNDVAIATGGIADLVEKVVKKHFIHFGKPDAQMFMYTYEQLLMQEEIDKSEILMVGDTLHTDIIGGNKFGLDTALVLTGNTSPHRAEMLIRTTGIIPNYICESIAV